MEIVVGLVTGVLIGILSIYTKTPVWVAIIIYALGSAYGFIASAL